MNKLINFVKRFTKKEVPELDEVKKIGRQYFLLDEELEKTMAKLSKAGLEPYSAGVFLGDAKDGFTPGFALLELLAKYSDRISTVNKKGETMFLFRRLVFGDSVMTHPETSGAVLVVNEKKEVLGWGELVVEKDPVTIKPRLDRGDFLRREN